MIVLDKMLTRLSQEGHKVLLFSHSVCMLKILEEYLKAKEWKYRYLDGSAASHKVNISHHYSILQSI